MGVDVDEPRGEQQAVGVDLAAALRLDAGGHLGDALTGNGHVAPTARAPGAVDDGGAADHEVGHAPCSRVETRIVKAMVIYESLTGNTRRAAGLIGGQLAAGG